MRSLLFVLYILVCAIPLSAQNDGDIKTNNGSPFSQSKFVPDISLIVDFSGVGRTVRNETYAALEIPGFTHAHTKEKSDHHARMNAQRGFNLNYGELVLSSIVDPYFDLFATFHLSESGFAIEDAYGATRALPFGLNIRAGKFRSHFGRTNEQHAHARDFAGIPLVYAVFFGEEGLNEKGLRITWVVPIPFYCLIGGEILQGQNESSFGASGFTDAANSNTVHDSEYPNLGVGYVKASFDIGELTVLFGASAAVGNSRINNGVDDAADPAGNAVYARCRLYGADLTCRYSIDSYRYIALQGEYLYRRMEGTRYGNTGDKTGLSKNQSGLYCQMIARFAMRWRIGARYDQLQKNSVKTGGAMERLPENLARYAGMIDWTPTEFSRIRLQYSQDRSGYLHEGADRTINHELLVQMTMAIGAHGAHSF